MAHPPSGSRGTSRPTKQTDRRQSDPSASSSKPTSHPPSDQQEEGDDDDSEESILSRTALSLANNPLPSLSALTSTLSRFTNLHRLDLSSLQASEDNPEGLTSLSWLAKAVQKSQKAKQPKAFGDNLTWLNLGSNEHLDDQATKGLEALKQLFVLTLSHCSLTVLPPSITPLTKLKALVLNNNAIASLPTSFPHLPQLNTLILSHNKLVSLPDTLPASLPALKKLSVAHNDLDDGTKLPDFSLCLALREVRLNANPRIKRLPTNVEKWGKGADGKTAPGLEILDLGDCGLENWASLSGLVKDSPPQDEERSRRRGIANLTLKGNGVASEPEYKEKVLAQHPTIKVLDNERVVAKVHPQPKIKEKKERPKRHQDSGYANIRKSRDLRDEDEEDEDEDDEEAARMAAEMRRALRAGGGDEEEDKPRSDRPKRGKEEATRRGKKEDRKAAPAPEPEQPESRKSKHKRGGARTKKKSASTEETPKSKDAFFEEAEAPRIPKKAAVIKEGVVEDAGDEERQEEGKRRRAKRGGSAKKREMEMGDADEGHGSGDESNPVKKKKEKPKTAWDAGSERIAPAVPAAQPEVGAAEAPKETRGKSSVAAIVNVKKQPRKRSVEDGDMPKPPKKQKTEEVGAGSGDAWGGGASAWS